VVGLAPSAAAAAVLGEQTRIRTDTLAKLTWSLHHGDLPGWTTQIGPSTLVIIDEAGMADTVSLDTAVQFVIARGGSVRLVGDDQQLAAIGAGGVLRDITHIHGAFRLTELHRLTDPAEAAASLALRDGDPSGLEFYLDHGRIHVGDIATTTEQAFNAWVSDRADGLDTVMIAPTRNLVAQLNARARAHRLDHSPAASEVLLADRNRASVGDVIITRSNDRRLRLTATDWVKNGDRWTITHISRHGELTVRHNRSRHTVLLPADYVRTSTGLGYATTHPHRPRRLRRHHARPRNRTRDPAAAVHHAHPRSARQPPLPPGRRRRRPAHSHSPRDRRTAHIDRDLAADPRS
jgi:ATP-dependent exoDNAse (exonuclease V) alpha subunit